jgi:hypothetical protein
MALEGSEHHIREANETHWYFAENSFVSGFLIQAEIPE